jgi:ribosomal-protein-alanine N-acetyltransferase
VDAFGAKGEYIMKNIKEFPKIKANNIILREIVEGDKEDFFQIFGSDDVLKYYGMRAYKSEEDSFGLMKRMINLFHTKRGIRWAITLNNSDQLIGTIGFKYWDTRSKKSEISYEIKKDLWNKGIATQAIAEVVKFGFLNGLNRIEAWDMDENQASKKVLLKNNFVLEGILREHTYWDGKFQNIEWFSILKREYTNK